MRMPALVAVFALLSLSTTSPTGTVAHLAAQQTAHFDLLIRGGRTIRNDSIHRKAAPNVVSQGVTTIVVNQDGRSPWPVADQRATLEAQGAGPNVMLMVGHGTVRRLVLEDDFRRPSTAAETARMAALVRQALEEGAVGLSAGLEYSPGRWSTTDEVAVLAAELAPYDGVYISHERAEGADPMWYLPSQHEGRPPTLQDAVLETIEIGRRTGVRVVASHIKAKGVAYWGSSASAIQIIQRARRGRARVRGSIPLPHQRCARQRRVRGGARRDPDGAAGAGDRLPAGWAAGGLRGVAMPHAARIPRRHRVPFLSGGRRRPRPIRLPGRTVRLRGQPAARGAGAKPASGPLSSTTRRPARRIVHRRRRWCDPRRRGGLPCEIGGRQLDGSA